MNRFKIFKIHHLIVIVVFILGCETDPFEEELASVKGESDLEALIMDVPEAKATAFAYGSGTTVPTGVNIVSYVNSQTSESTFYLKSGIYLASGIITRNNIVITRETSNDVPRIKGWFDVRGGWNIISYLTWDGDDWTSASQISNPPNALLFVSGPGNEIDNNTFRDINNLEDIVMIWAGTGSDHNTYDVSYVKIQSNKIKNWKHKSGFIFGIMLGNFHTDVPPATGAKIRWNYITNGPTVGHDGCFCGNDAIIVADGPLDYFTGFVPSAYQPVTIESNLITEGYDAMSIKANNVLVQYNVIRYSNSGSSPGIQNRFGSFNVFKNNLITNANGAGIMIWSGDNLVFRNNIIRDSKRGILFRGKEAFGAGVAGKHILLTNNTFVRNDDNVVFYYDGNSTEFSYHEDVVFINNIFYKKDGASATSFEVDVQAVFVNYNIWLSISKMSHNLLANGFAAPPSGNGSCESCIITSSGSGIFDNVALNNFDLESVSSPAINAGRTWSHGMPTEDYERKPRPISQYDIGAIEKNGY